VIGAIGMDALASVDFELDVARRLYGFDASSPGVQTETDAAGDEISHYIAMKMTAPGLTVTHPKIALVPPPKRDEGCQLKVAKARDEGAGYVNCIALLLLGRRHLTTVAPRPGL
jgi:hypothetical protein